MVKVTKLKIIAITTYQQLFYEFCLIEDLNNTYRYICLFANIK